MLRNQHGQGGLGGDWGGGGVGGGGGSLGPFLCAARGPGTPPPTRGNAAPCGECLLPDYNPSVAGTSEAPGTSAAKTTSAGGGGERDAQKSEHYLLSFTGSKLSRHLRHIYFKREEAMEGMLALVYDGVDGIVYRPDLARVYIALGRDNGGRGVGVQVA